MPDAAIDELMAELKKYFWVNTVAIMALAGADNVVAVGFIPDVNSMPAAEGQMMADPLKKKKKKTKPTEGFLLRNSLV